MILLAAAGTSASAGDDFGVAWVGDINFTDTVLSPASSSAFFTINTDGSVTGNDGQSADWRIPNVSSIGDKYQVRFTLDSGDIPTNGTLNTWLDINAPRTIENIQSGVGDQISSVLVEIRNKVSLVVRISQLVGVSAIVSS